MARLSEAEVLHKRNQLVVQGFSMVRNVMLNLCSINFAFGQTTY